MTDEPLELALWVNDQQYRTMLIEQLGITDTLDPLLEADIPSLEAAVMNAGMTLPIVRRRTPDVIDEPKPE